MKAHLLLRRSSLPLVFGALGLLAGCAAPEDPTPFPSGADRAALLAARLEADTGVPWNVEVDSAGAPLVLSPLGRLAPSSAPGAPHARAIVDFLSKYEDAFGVARLGDELSIEQDVADDPAVLPPETKALHHVRLSQQIPGSGVKVFGSDLLAHYDDEGALVLVETAVTQGLASLSATPTVSPEDATRAALGAMTPVDEANTARVHRAPELVVYRDADDRGHLAYRLVLELVGYERLAPEVYVDAQTSAILSVAETAAHASRVVEAKNAYSYLPSTVTRPEGVSTTSRITIRTDEPSLAGPTNRLVREGDRDTTTITTDVSILVDPTGAAPRWPLVSTDPTTFDFLHTDTGHGNGAAVNVHENLALTDAYFRRLGLRGWDGRGRPVTAAVRAVYRKSDGVKGKGEWAPLTAYFNDVVYFEDAAHDQDGRLVHLPYGVALDVVAHEFAHGVTSHFAHLEHLGEAGALDEGISDVFGAGVEHAFRPSSDPFRTADDAFRVQDGPQTRQPSHGALRDMRDPRSLPPEPAPISGRSQVPRTYDERWPTTAATDDGYTHVNSVIASHAYYLMTMGGTNAKTLVTVPHGGALGWDRGQMLWLLTVQHGLGGPYATFKSFARVQIGLARGAGWHAPVACAWRAVNVLSDAEVRAYGVTCPTRAEPPDSCAGRADGAYCSDLALWAALVCKSGQIASGVQCPTGRSCARTTPGEGSPAALDAEGRVLCR